MYSYYKSNQPELYKRATELLKIGLTKKAIAERLNVSYDLLLKVLKSGGIKNAPKNHISQ